MIRVNNDYIIDIDSLNYTVKRDLHKTTIKKDDKLDKEIETPLFSTVGYYSDLTGALKGVIDDMNRRALSLGVHDLQEAVTIVLENNKYLSELLERVLEV